MEEGIVGPSLLEYGGVGLGGGMSGVVGRECIFRLAILIQL